MVLARLPAAAVPAGNLILGQHAADLKGMAPLLKPTIANNLLFPILFSRAGRGIKRASMLSHLHVAEISKVGSCPALVSLWLCPAIC